MSKLVMIDIDKKEMVAKEESHIQDIALLTERRLRMGSWSYELETDTTWWSRGVFDIYGLDPSERVVPDTMSYFSAEGIKILTRCMTEAISDGKSWNEILKMFPVNSEPIWVRSTGFPVKVDGKTIISGTIQDVTEDYEQAEFTNSLVEQLPSQVFLTDVQRKIVYSNQREVVGNPDEIINKDVVSIFPEAFQENVVNCMSGAKKTDLPLIINSEFESDIFGSKIYIETIVSPVRIQDEFRGFIFIANDVTEKVSKQLEYEHQQAVAQQNAKLASIGELAAGVGHEINNPLAILTASLENLETQLATNQGLNSNAASSLLGKMHNSVHRISEIVNGLRTFARADDESVEVVDLRAAARNTVSFVKEMYSKDEIDIELSEAKHPVLAEVNVGKVQQVILNLLNNAKDVLIDSSVKKIKVEVFSEKMRSLVRVSDSGPGIPEKVKDEVFKAFFTTKAVNKGTGMGLYISNSIVRRYAGSLCFGNSELGGASFTIDLPLSEKDNDDFTDQVEPLNEPQSVSGLKILLVDDEEDIRELVSAILEVNGHQVETAENGVAALERYKANSYDVVLSDLKMPKMGGVQFFQKIHELEKSRPLLLFMTGANEESTHNLADEILLKPFSIEDLQQILAIHFNSQKRAS